MQVRIGTWCGGCYGQAEGTIQWSGGPTTFEGAPYIMTITSLEIDNANPAGSYIYSDNSGSASSIKLGGAVALPKGNSSAGTLAQSRPVSLASYSASSSKSSIAPKSSDPPTSSSAPTLASDNTQSVTTINVGPTSNHLSSPASKLSLGGVTAVIIGAVLLLGQY